MLTATAPSNALWESNRDKSRKPSRPRPRTLTMVELAVAPEATSSSPPLPMMVPLAEP
jgi:hypothetical protein